MKCQTIRCNKDATHEFYNLHHGFAVTVHCKKHKDDLGAFFSKENMCAVIKEINT